MDSSETKGTDDPVANRDDSRRLLRAVIASTIGTSIEWYDFFVYGIAAALVFNHEFFPNHDPLTGTLLAFGTYSVGFAARPIGAAIFGHYGDRTGRKSTLIASLLLMGISTFAVGLVPPYSAIGAWSGLILTALRFVQGIGVGGEWGGAVLIAMERGAGSRRRGLIASWPQFGVPAGQILANGAIATTAALTGSGFDTWGWRIPFVLSILLIGIGLYIRLGVLESPIFRRLATANRLSQAPIIEVLRRQWREVLLTCLIRTGQNAPLYLFYTFVLTYTTTKLGLDRETVLNFVILAGAISLITVPLWGHVSDRVGRRVYIAGAAAMALFAFPYYLLLDTAIPLGYHLASLTAGGPAPLIATYLLRVYYNSTPIALYVLVCACVSLVSAVLLPDRSQQSIDDDYDQP